MEEAIQHQGQEYTDLVPFLQKYQLLAQICHEPFVSIVLLTARVLEYEVNMLEDEDQEKVLRAHIVLPVAVPGFPSLIHRSHLWCETQSIPIQYRSHVLVGSTQVTFFTCYHAFVGAVLSRVVP